MRMDSQSFQNLITNIETHSIFQSTGNKQQAPVELQLAIFLRRVGSKDEIFSICSRYGISEGTVYLYCKRVMLAILSLKSSLVIWPTGQARKMVHSGFKDIGGFNNVIGAIDGTHIILGTAPLQLVLLKKTDLIGTDLNLICQIQIRSNIFDLQFIFSSKKF